MIISLHLHKCLRVVFFCDRHTKHSREELPTSKVRGRSWEDPMPEGRRPRGVTPRLRSGAAAQSARLRLRSNRGEELLHVRSQRQRPEEATPPPRSSGCAGTGGPRGAIPRSRSGGAALRRHPSSKVRETQVRQ